MKENNYSKRGWEHRPKSKRLISRTPFCAAILSCLLTGVVSADAPPAILDADAEMPVLSHQAEVDAVVTSSGSEMPALSAAPVEIGSMPGPTPDVGAQVLPPELVQTDALVEYEASAQDKSVSPNLMSASLTPADYDRPRDAVSKKDGIVKVSTQSAADDVAVVRENDDQMQMPYALVLALIAIIGLVPVSRRNL